MAKVKNVTITRAFSESDIRNEEYFKEPDGMIDIILKDTVVNKTENGVKNDFTKNRGTSIAAQLFTILCVVLGAMICSILILVIINNSRLPIQANLKSYNSPSASSKEDVVKNSHPIKKTDSYVHLDTPDATLHPIMQSYKQPKSFTTKTNSDLKGYEIWNVRFKRDSVAKKFVADNFSIPKEFGVTTSTTTVKSTINIQKSIQLTTKRTKQTICPTFTAPFGLQIYQSPITPQIYNYHPIAPGSIISIQNHDSYMPFYFQPREMFQNMMNTYNQLSSGTRQPIMCTLPRKATDSILGVTNDSNILGVSLLGHRNKTRSSRQCPYGEISCEDGSRCIKDRQRCDSEVHCKDGSDEEFCPCKTRVMNSRICDGYFDCPNGEDELHCFGCELGMFSCDDWSPRQRISTCIPMEQRCDGIPQCPTERDELDCSVLVGQLGATHFMVTKTEGYLYRNFKGSWYPACRNPELWANDACQSEIGLSTVAPLTHLVPVDVEYDGFYVSATNSGTAEIADTCERHAAVYVECPPLVCGMRVQETNPFRREEVDTSAERILEQTSSARLSGSSQNEGDSILGSSRVVGGLPSQPKSWPWIVSVYRNGVFHCGGALINQIWIVTAAHCVDRYSRYYYEIQAGVLRRYSYSPMVQNRVVDHVIAHQFYDRHKLKNDIALMKISKPLEFNRYVRPICLPSETTAGKNFMWGPEAGTLCTAVGWGATVEHGTDPDHLREVKVPVHKKCKHREDEEGHEICAGLREGGKDACQGDSGGPFMCRNPNLPNQWYLAGIVSHGEGCARPNEPGVYTRVSLFLGWIFEHIGAEVLSPRRPLRHCPGYACKESKKCIGNKRRCDKVVDCLEGDDEMNCQSNTFPEIFKNAMRHMFLRRSEVALNITSNVTNKDYDNKNITKRETKVTNTNVTQLMDEGAKHLFPIHKIKDSSASLHESIPMLEEDLPISETSISHSKDMETVPLNQDDNEKIPQGNGINMSSSTTSETITSLERTSCTSLINEPETTPTNDKQSIENVPEVREIQVATSTLRDLLNTTTLTIGPNENSEDTSVTPFETSTTLMKPILTTTSTNENQTIENLPEVREIQVETSTLGALLNTTMSTTGPNENSEDISAKTFETSATLMEPIQIVQTDLTTPTSPTWKLAPIPFEEVNFHCKTIKQTISISKVCDRNADCEDGSDEESCRCVDYLKYQFPSTLCDGVTHCLDKSDEQNCSNCNANQYHCRQSNVCINFTRRCDNISDCPLEDDEMDCFALTNGRTISLDVDSRPYINKSGIVSINRNGVWRVFCSDQTTHKASIAADICFYLGFSDYNNYMNIFVNNTTLLVQPNLTSYLSNKQSEQKIEKCTGIFVKCSNNVDIRHQSQDVSFNSTARLETPWNTEIYINGVYKCTGTLVELEWVVTSSHCLSVNTGIHNHYITILLGGSSHLPIVGPFEQVRQVADVLQVENTTISLLRLDKVVKTTRYVRPIGLDVKKYIVSESRICLAQGASSLNNSNLIYLKPERDCSYGLRCFRKEKVFLNCDKQHSSLFWSGSIVCRSIHGWYPAAVYYEALEGCGFENSIAVDSIQYWKSTILRLMKQPYFHVIPPICKGVRCSLGSCLSFRSVCDGIQNCFDGADEDPSMCSRYVNYCSSNNSCHCAKSELRCNNGRCIPKAAFCDKINDCGDWSDEPVVCNCRAYLNLAYPLKVCDGVRNCLDRSDEDPHVCKCTHSSFVCGRSGKCVTHDVVCDGYTDCPNGEDELHCISLISSQKSPLTEVQIRTAGVWHSGCFSKTVSTLQLEEICAEIGYTGRSAKRLIPGENVVRYGGRAITATFQNIWIRPNEETKFLLSFRDGNEPYVTLKADVNCFRLFMQCL